MKILKSSVIISALAILFISVSAFAQKRDWPAAPSFESPTPGKMPVIATYAFYDEEFLTPEKYKEVEEAGINLIVQQPKRLQKTVEAIEGTDIGIIFSYPSKEEMYRLNVNKYHSWPQIKGYFMIDEPKISQFKDVKNRQSFVQEIAPGSMTYTNLLPSVSPDMLGAPDYRTYVEEFVMNVNPPMLSFDCYPIKVSKSGGTYIYHKYFETLETIRDVAEESGRPFYAFVQSSQFPGVPKPTEDYLRFQVFNALAYGAQGLAYFTYTQPDFDVNNTYSHYPIDNEGKKTESWYLLRNINREVKNLEKVFLGAKVLDVSHTGVRLPEGTKRLKSVPAPFKWLASDGKGVLVSHLKNGNDEYVVIVNSDHENRQKVRMEKSRPVVRIFGDGSEKADSTDSVTLSPGGYAIYRL